MKLNPDVIMKENFDGSGILYDVGKRKLMSINETGILIWKALEDGLDTDAIVKLLISGFNVTEENAQKDVGNFLRELTSRDILSD